MPLATARPFALEIERRPGLPLWGRASVKTGRGGYVNPASCVGVFGAPPPERVEIFPKNPAEDAYRSNQVTPSGRHAEDSRRMGSTVSGCLALFQGQSMGQYMVTGRVYSILPFKFK